METLRAAPSDPSPGMRAKYGQRVLPSAPPLGPKTQTAPETAPETVAEPAPVAEPVPAPVPEVVTDPVADPVVPSPARVRGGVDDGEFDADGSERKFEAVASQEGIALYRHRKNKLRVALVPLSANRVVSITIVYLVGSNAEVTGMTGSAHILGKSPCKTICVHRTDDSRKYFQNTNSSNSFPGLTFGNNWEISGRALTRAPAKRAPSFTARCPPSCSPRSFSWKRGVWPEPR